MSEEIINKDILETLETGDILLFDGEELESKIVEEFIMSKWSHVAIVIKDPDFLINHKEPINGLFVFESNGYYELDIEDNTKKFGVQISELNKYIEDYDGEVYVRKLNWNKTHEERNALFKQIYITMYNKYYDFHPLDLLDIIFHRLHIHIGILDTLVNPRHTDSLVCSSLVAYSYTCMGLLEQNTDWSLIAPQYFEDINELLDNAKLEDVICVKEYKEHNSWFCNIF
jgi:hypothetical protein